MFVGHYAAALAARAAEPKAPLWSYVAACQLLDIGWGKEACLNINFPPLPAEECGPITLARQGAGWSVYGRPLC